MKKSKILMLAAVLLPALTLFFFPLWNITLHAPQYPGALGMNIYINKIAGVQPNDVQNINLMNHYVGMKKIPKSLPEFVTFPIVVTLMTLLGLFAFFKGNYKHFLAWCIILSLLGCLGVYDFYLWEYDYGHTLDPRAIIKFTNPDGTPMVYQPPLLGTKKLLNFTVHSYPRAGAIFLLITIALSFLAFWMGRIEARQSRKLSS